MSQSVVNLPFSRQEYAQRLAKTRAAMQAQGLTCCWSPIRRTWPG